MKNDPGRIIIMLEIDVPGYKVLRLKYMVLDYNGTLAVDGQLVDGVRGCLGVLAKDLDIHVITADTFGKVRSGMDGIPCKVSVLPVDNQAEAKLEYVRTLGAEKTVSMGNGRNDRLMLKDSALGIAVILGEGAAAQTLSAADVVCTGIVSAMELLLNPLRLTATLRS
jgi:soluble P-type ATPase